MVFQRRYIEIILFCSVRLCLDTLGCSNFSFRYTNGLLGNCATIAPTDAAVSDIPDADSADWNYYTVE